MDWFLYDIGLRRERVKTSKKEKKNKSKCQWIANVLLQSEKNRSLTYFTCFLQKYNYEMSYLFKTVQVSAH